MSEKNYADLTVVELKATAKDLFVSPLPRTKNALIVAILEAEAVKAKVAEKAPAKAVVAARIVETEHALDDALDAGFGPESIRAKNRAIGPDMASRKPHRKGNAQDKRLNLGLREGLPSASQLDEALHEHADTRDFPAERDYSNGEMPVEHGEGEQPSAESAKSDRKAEAFAADVAPLGWTTRYYRQGTRTEAITSRGTGSAEETIYQQWDSGVYQMPATYTYGPRTVMVRNASAAKQLAGRAATVAAAEFEKVVANRSFRRSSPTEVRTTRLPFDPALATDAEVISALLGKGVKWTNRISNGSESAIIGRESSRVHITEFAGDRVVRFCCPVSGFRAFRLGDLLAVGRGKPTSNKGDQDGPGQSATVGVAVETA